MGGVSAFTAAFFHEFESYAPLELFPGFGGGRPNVAQTGFRQLAARP